MFKLIVFTLIQFSTTWAAVHNIEVKEARESIESLITPLLGPSKKSVKNSLDRFRVDKCEKYKINWMNVLLMKESATLTYHFKEGCDIEGSFTPKLFQSFPIALKLKNLQSYEKISTQNTIFANIESKPILRLEMREGELTGKNGSVKFEVDYAVQINPANRSKVLEKNLGGEIRISEIYGKKTAIKEKIKIE
ncbi:MAG: hypothetical protein AB7I27_17200 [Bacteriovoracaceae bacterium]